MSKLKQFPLHPWLFSAYPVLALLAANIDQVKSSAALRSLLISLTAATIIWVLLKLLFRDWRRTAVLVSIYFILFLSYGHVYHFLETHPIAGLALGRHRILFFLWLLLVAGSTWAALRITRRPQKITEAFNLVGVLLIAMPIASMLVFTIRSNTYKIESAKVGSRAGQIVLQSSLQMPDIYYIVLDAYTREDVLKEKFDLDNGAFLSELENMGFYVAHCSQSNYGLTELSIASTLQMDYMDQISERYLGGKIDKIWMPDLIRDNEMRRNLKKLGYTDVIFENGFYWLLWDDADVIYSQNRSVLSREGSFLDVNGFEVMLLQESAAQVLIDSLSIFSDRFITIKKYPNNVHRDRILYMFEKLKALPTIIESPKLVYAHFIAPHAPIVFGPNGEPMNPLDETNPESYIAGYRGEVLYLNKRILEIVRGIITESATPPVIIIQGDHGDDNAPPGDRLKIFNAYYLPGVDQGKLYPTISPVNSFRLVFDEYFGGNYNLLPDKSYFSTYQEPFTFQEIPNLCADGK